MPYMKEIKEIEVEGEDKGRLYDKIAITSNFYMSMGDEIETLLDTEGESEVLWGFKKIYGLRLHYSNNNKAIEILNKVINLELNLERVVLKGNSNEDLNDILDSWDFNRQLRSLRYIIEGEYTLTNKIINQINNSKIESIKFYI